MLLEEIDEYFNKIDKKYKKIGKVSWKDKCYNVSNDEMVELTLRWQKTNSDIEKNKIAERVIEKTDNFVRNRVYWHFGKDYYDDLVQEGKIGIAKTMEYFDINKGKISLLLPNGVFLIEL